MNVRSFRDDYSRKLEMFMEQVESGKYKPLSLTDLDELTREEWWELFKTWLMKNP